LGDLLLGSGGKKESRSHLSPTWQPSTAPATPVTSNPKARPQSENNPDTHHGVFKGFLEAMLEREWQGAV